MRITKLFVVAAAVIAFGIITTTGQTPVASSKKPQYDAEMAVKAGADKFGMRHAFLKTGSAALMLNNELRHTVQKESL